MCEGSFVLGHWCFVVGTCNETPMGGRCFRGAMEDLCCVAIEAESRTPGLRECSSKQLFLGTVRHRFTEHSQKPPDLVLFKR